MLVVFFPGGWVVPLGTIATGTIGLASVMAISRRSTADTKALAIELQGELYDLGRHVKENYEGISR